MASKKVHLYSYSGEIVSTSEIKIAGVDAIIFSNQVFLFRHSEGEVDVYREVSAERVRHTEILTPHTSSHEGERK